MTSGSDIERLLDTWLGDGPDRVADRVLDDVALRISRQPQRAAWRLQTWRFPTMSSQIRLAAVLGAVLVGALAGGVLIFGGGGRSSVPTTSPSAAPSAAPSGGASAAASPTAIALHEGVLPAATYAAVLNAGRLTLTVPAGWSAANVSPFDFTLHLDAGAKDDTVKVFTDMRRASKAATCPEAPETLGNGDAAGSLARSFGADSRLAATGLDGIALPSGLAGDVVDVALAPGVTSTCPFSQGQPSVPLVVDTIPGEGAFWGIGPRERIRLVILDGQRGHNVVVVIDSSDGSTFDALVAATMPIVQTFSFEAGEPLAVLPTCEDDLFGCAGPLDAGAHRSAAFEPALTFTTPAGWTNVVDTPTIFKLDPSSSSDPYVIVWSNVAIPDGCGPTILKGSGRKVSDFVNFVSHHAGIQVLSNMQGLVGRWTARILDLRMKDSWGGGCGDVTGRVVQFIVDTDPLAGPAVYGVASGSRMHVVFVDVNGETVIIQAYGPDSDAGMTAAMATVQPLIDSFQLAPAN
jgi:hypothetical protein